MVKLLYHLIKRKQKKKLKKVHLLDLYRNFMKNLLNSQTNNLSSDPEPIVSIIVLTYNQLIILSNAY